MKGKVNIKMVLLKIKSELTTGNRVMNITTNSRSSMNIKKRVYKLDEFGVLRVLNIKF